MTTGCLHSDLIEQYAEDCQYCKEPWLLWEFRYVGSPLWRTCDNHPAWLAGVEYRRKPQPQVPWFPGIARTEYDSTFRFLKDLSNWIDESPFDKPANLVLRLNALLGRHKHDYE